MPTASPSTRPGTAVGRFYDLDPTLCAAEARRLCRPYPDEHLPATLHGAIVPHAGWMCSGRIAGGTLATLARHTPARTFVLTGSVHHYDLDGPATDGFDAWETPLGVVEIDGELRQAINDLEGFAPVNEAHVPEHSLEVQLPLMQTAMGPDIRFVPCLIPPKRDAPKWGACLGALLKTWPAPVAVIASSDLTHYGPEYGFTPAGTGPEARAWAHDENDGALLGLVERMQTKKIVPTALRHGSACGSGAIAATMAAARVIGADAGYVIEHTDSARELGRLGGQDAGLNFVGYAGVVLG